MAGVRSWVQNNATFANLMMIAVMFVTLVKNTGAFALTLQQVNSENSQAIADQAKSLANLTLAVAALTTRVDNTERNWLILNESIAKEFPRRSELDPRLRAIEKAVEDSNMLSRRLFERYRSPDMR